MAALDGFGRAPQPGRDPDKRFSFIAQLQKKRVFSIRPGSGQANPRHPSHPLQFHCAGVLACNSRAERRGHRLNEHRPAHGSHFLLKYLEHFATC
jgi:hypothetical protein